MGIALKIGHFHTFQTAKTLDWVIQHTVVDHSQTSTYILNFIQIVKKMRTDGWVDTETSIFRLTKE